MNLHSEVVVSVTKKLQIQCWKIYTDSQILIVIIKFAPQ